MPFDVKKVDAIELNEEDGYKCDKDSGGISMEKIPQKNTKVCFNEHRMPRTRFSFRCQKIDNDETGIEGEALGDDF